MTDTTGASAPTTAAGRALLAKLLPLSESVTAHLWMLHDVSAVEREAAAAAIARVRAAWDEIRAEHQPGRGPIHPDPCAVVIARDFDAILDAEAQP